LKARLRSVAKLKARRLAELGINEESYAQYKQMFCLNRNESGYLDWGPGGWRTSGYRWWDGLILQHLLHERTVGLFPASRINYLMFDIDNHDPENLPSPESRARAIIDVFDADPLVYTSSDSGGLRVCYFLEGFYKRDDVLIWAQKQLEDAGMPLRSGYIEIMATKKADRLPFGEGSYIVDTFNCEPRYELTLKQMIDEAWEVYDSERLGIPTSHANRDRCSTGTGEFSIDVRELLEEGLPDSTATNEALLKLNYHYMGTCGYSAESSACALKSWIREHHNGNSNRVNDGKLDEVDDQIERITASFDISKTNFKGHKISSEHKHLRLSDVNVILDKFSGYRDQLAVFSLLEYVKNWGKLSSEEAEPSKGSAQASPSVTQDSSISNLYVVSFLQEWVCEIPYKTFQRLPGFNRRYPKKTVDLLTGADVIKLWKKEDRKANKCRTYKVFFNFDGDSQEVVSLDQALQILKAKTQLKDEYGRYRSEQIKSGVSV